MEDGIGDVMSYVNCDEESGVSAAAVETPRAEASRGVAAQPSAGLLLVIAFAILCSLMSCQGQFSGTLGSPMLQGLEVGHTEYDKKEEGKEADCAQWETCSVHQIHLIIPGIRMKKKYATLVFRGCSGGGGGGAGHRAGRRERATAHPGVYTSGHIQGHHRRREAAEDGGEGGGCGARRSAQGVA